MQDINQHIAKHCRNASESHDLSGLTGAAHTEPLAIRVSDTVRRIWIAVLPLKIGRGIRVIRISAQPTTIIDLAVAELRCDSGAWVLVRLVTARAAIWVVRIVQTVVFARSTVDIWIIQATMIVWTVPRHACARFK